MCQHGTSFVRYRCSRRSCAPRTCLSECLILTVPRGEVRTCAEAMNYRLWDEWLWTTAAPISELRVMACQQEFPRMPRPDDRLQA